MMSSSVSSSAAASMSRPATMAPVLITSRSATWPISTIVSRTSGWDRRVRVPHAGDLRDVPGEVAHALQVRAHPQAGHDQPQVGGHRRLPGHRGDRLLLELGVQPVDLLVGGDDALRQHEVGVEEGPWWRAASRSPRGASSRPAGR
jgi:hypothetical protein